MFDIDTIQGTWPDAATTVVFTACDHAYHTDFFERWRKGFSQWPVHLHLHAVDVPRSQLPLGVEGLTVTHEDTTHWDWTAMKRRYDPLQTPQWRKYRATYEWYCQSIRYYLAHKLLEHCENVIVTDVDAVALRTPTPPQLQVLCRDTQFNVRNSRLYANFCNIHSRDMAQARALAVEIKDNCLIGSAAGNDQAALKKIFKQPRRMDDCWTDQEDINDPRLLDEKLKKIVFHAKGTRGKNFKPPTL